MLLLTMLTVLVLFVATWSSLFVAKLVTRPVEALALATREISLGHLGHRVEVSAADELGELVHRSINMAAELESSRMKIDQSARSPDRNEHGVGAAATAHRNYSGKYSYRRTFAGPRKGA